MSDLKPKATKIKLGKNEYGLRFTLNAIDDIQDKFDTSISELYKLLQDDKNGIKTLKYLLTLLINEDIECRNDDGEDIKKIDEKFVGRYIDIKNMGEIMDAVMQSFMDSTPKADEEDEEIPNAVSE